MLGRLPPHMGQALTSQQVRPQRAAGRQDLRRCHVERHGAPHHLTRIDDTEDTDAGTRAREALSYLHRVMGISAKSRAVGGDWVAMVGPEALRRSIVSTVFQSSTGT